MKIRIDEEKKQISFIFSFEEIEWRIKDIIRSEESDWLEYIITYTLKHDKELKELIRNKIRLYNVEELIKEVINEWLRDNVRFEERLYREVKDRILKKLNLA